MSGWEKVRLSDVCQFKPPKSIARAELSEEDLVSFVPMNDLGELEKHFEAKETRLFGDVVRGYTYFADNDVLCAKITPCFENGKLGIARGLVNGVGFGSSEFVVMRPGDKLAPEFLYYYLARDEFRVAGTRVMTGAVGHKRVPKEYFEDLLIPLPSADEQQRIVAILDQAFAALDTVRGQAEAGYVACRELISAELDAQVEKHFQEASIKAFDDLTSETQIGLVRNKKEQRPNLPYDYIKMQHIGSDGRYLGQIVDRVACSPSELKRYSVVSGDFLFNTRNSRELVGKSCVIQFPLERDTVFNNNIMRVRFRPEVLPEYAAILFRSRIVREQLELMKSGTTSVVAIYHKSLKRLRLPVPSIRDQEALISRIVQVDKVVDVIAENYEKQIADAVVLRQSLLQQAFSGKLT